MSLKTFAANFSRLWKEPEGKKDNPILPTMIPTWQNAEGITYPSDIKLAQNSYKSIAALYICVKTRAEAFGAVPLKLYRKLAEGELEEIAEHEILDLLYDPNPPMSYTDFWGAISTFLDLTGNAYIFLDMDRKEMWPLRPNRVKIVGHPTEYIDYYTYKPDDSGTVLKIPKELIVHFKTANPTDDYYGLPPVEAGSLELASEYYAVKYNINFFKNDATPKTVFESEQALTDEDVKRIAAWWKALHQGVDNAHKIGIIGKGGKVNVIGTTLKEMEFNQLRKYEREMIYAIYKIPPAMGGMFDTPYQLNLKDQVKYIFWGQGINPGLRQREEILNQIFLPRLNAKNEKLLLKYDLNAIEILNESLSEKADTALKLRQTGWSVNELRELTGKPEVEGGELIPALQAPVFSFGQLGQDMPKHLIPLDIDSKRVRQYLSYHKELRNGSRMVAWKRFDATLSREEALFASKMVKFFGQQKERVLTKFDELNPRKSKRSAKFTEADWALLFDILKEVAELSKAGQGIMAATLEAGANAELSELNVAIDFNLTDPVVKRYLERKIYTFATKINDTTQEALKETLAKGVAEGWSIQQMRNEINDLWDGWAIPDKIDALARTEMIARTETIGAYNYGKLAGMMQSGVVKGKEWLSSRDERVRDAHQIDGEQVGVMDAFSNGLFFPGDQSTGNPADFINCRCSILDVLEELT